MHPSPARSTMTWLLSLAAIAFLTHAGSTRPNPLPTSEGLDRGAVFDPQTADADRLWAEGAYEQARGRYAALARELEEGSAARAWCEFREVDSAWRSLAKADDPDTSDLDAQRVALETIVGRVSQPEDRDRVWAEASESLADYHWERERTWNFYGALPHYEAALDFWARSGDLERARRRFLDIVFRMASPPWAPDPADVGRHNNWPPLARVEQAAQIAQEARDEAFATYLMARTASHQSSGPAVDRRAREAFERLRELPRELGFLELALWHEAEWLRGSGLWARTAEGQPMREPDLHAALALYRELRATFRSGESRFWRTAGERIEDILREELGVRCDRAFAPGSAITAQLAWKNLGRAEAVITPVELARDVRFTSSETGVHDWLQQIDTSASEPLLMRELELEDPGDHRPRERTLEIDGWFDEPLAAGAYLLEVRSGGQRARDLVLVTDGCLVLEASGADVELWYVEAASGRPRAEAQVVVWGRAHSNPAVWSRYEAVTDESGMARVELAGAKHHVELFAAAKDREHQAFCTSGTRLRDPAKGWRVYAVTDRPAYRPDQEVQWKITARRYSDLLYTTPSGARLKYTVTGPRGEDLVEDEVTLSEFGTAWGSFDTTAEMALGAYQIQFRDADSGDWIGSAQLFRLEEYKLPEFEVTVSLPEGEDGRREVFVLGDTVRATIEARTYFGAPVAGGEVEVVVTRRPYWHRPTPRGRFAWFEESLSGGSRGYGWWGQEEVLRRNLVTDPEGRTEISFDTPFVDSQEYVYTVQARVVDASRREVTGTGTVNVRRQAYSVDVLAGARLVEPGASAELRFLARDANDNAVEVSGTAHLYRAVWREVWVDPLGERVAGRALAEARASVAWPIPGWRQLVADYDLEQVGRVELATDPEGEATWKPTLEREGSYLVRWISQDPRSGEVVAETWLHACAPDTTSIGYAARGLELILDESAFVEGEPGQVMVVTDASDRWVWLRVAGTERFESRVLHLDGTVKLVRFDVDEKWVPNVSIRAAEVRERNVRHAQAEVVVPPALHFLELECALDEELYQPGAEGTLTVRATDHAGDPVRAELSLSLFDASVAAIQQDLSADPRNAFWGHRRWPQVQWAASVQQRPLVLLEAQPEDEIAMDRDALRSAGLEALGYAGRARKSDAPPPASAAPMEQAFEAEMDFADGMKVGQRSSREEARQDGGGEAQVVVRADFRETALWLPDLATGEDGTASTTVSFPDSTTRWKLVARACGTDASFGQEERDAARTSLPLVLRLARPRFLVVGDEATLSVVLDNTTADELVAAVRFEAEGLDVLGWLDDGALRTDDVGPLTVPPHASARRDFRVRAASAGRATLRATAAAGDVADGVELELPIEEHGLDVLVADAGRLDGERLDLAFEVPPAREGSVDLRVAVSPSLATTMLDALPYLTRYPYGCLEQTLSRFVPTTIAMRTLERLGIDPELVAAASFGGVEEAFVAKTHPEGREDFARFEDAAEEGLAKVLSWQRGDGSWAWFPGGEGNEWMTAYAVWSLALARDAGMDVSDGVFGSALGWIETRLVEARGRPDDQAWLLHALAEGRRVLDKDGLGTRGSEAYENLFANRTGLSSTGTALVALAAHAAGRTEDAATFAAMLANGVTRFDDPGSSTIGGPHAGQRLPLAHWGSPGRILRWSDGAIEATSFCLRALLTVDPTNELIAPAMTWLVKNRRGAQWNSTRDTAIAVLALCDYLAISGEASEPVAFRVTVGGEVVGEAELFADDLLVPSTFRVPGAESGVHAVVIERTSGSGPLYWTVSASAFSIEEPVEARASDLVVRRDLYRLRGRDTLLAGRVFERVALEDGGTLESGERVEVVLTLETDVAFEYLIVEDLKPAGLEATELQSGTPFHARQLRRDEVGRRFGEGAPHGGREGSDAALGTRGTTGRSLWVYRELRDRKIALFIDRLPEGVWEMRYVLRAETPGSFHALPAVGQAMYVPEIRGNSAEQRMEVQESVAQH